MKKPKKTKKINESEKVDLVVKAKPTEIDDWVKLFKSGQLKRTRSLTIVLI